MEALHLREGMKVLAKSDILAAFSGVERTVSKGSSGHIDRRGGVEPDRLTWFAWFDGFGVRTSEEKLLSGDKFQLCYEIAPPPKGNSDFKLSVSDDIGLELGTIWPICITSLQSKSLGLSHALATLDLPWGSDGADSISQERADWARHIVACVRACAGIETGRLETLARNRLILGQADSPESALVRAGAELSIEGLDSLPRQMRMTVFVLARYLVNLNHGSVLHTIEIQRSEDGTVSLFIPDLGIGLRMGCDVRLFSDADRAEVSRLGYEVFTKTCDPTSADRYAGAKQDTRLSTTSEHEAILCIGNLVARAALDFVPNFPASLDQLRLR